MDWRRKPKHKVLLIADDHKLREVDLDVDMASVTDHRSGRAWGLVPGAVIPRYVTRKSYLVLCSRCDGPFNARKGKWEIFDEAEVSRIAAQCADKQIAELPRLAIQQMAASVMRLSIAGLTLAIAVMAVVIAVSSGTVRVPGL